MIELEVIGINVIGLDMIELEVIGLNVIGSHDEHESYFHDKKIK